MTSLRIADEGPVRLTQGSAREGSPTVDAHGTGVMHGCLLDGVTVVVLTVFVAFLSGAEWFTFLHTVDSEFYFSLGAFGSQVTDRAPFDLYYWTKFGLNLPIHLLTGLTDPWTARLIWRLLLILLVVGSTFAVARPRASRVGAATAALFVALNTVVIGHIGDPYFAGTMIALMCLIIALTHHILFGRGGLPTAAALGATFAWILMTNPYGVFIGFGAVVGMTAARMRWLSRLGLLRLELLALTTIAGFAVGMTGFLAWGRQEYPNMDWLAEVKGFILTAPVESWAEKGWEWLWTETSLLVPVAAALVALGVTWQARDRPATQPLGSALGLVLVPSLLAVTYKMLSGGATLEASFYSALLWPPALLGLVIVATAVSTGRDRRGAAWAALAGSAAVWVAAGHLPGPCNPTTLAVLTLATSLGVVVLTRRWPMREAVAMVTVLGILGLLFQLNQNGRPPRSNDLSHDRVFYADAYRASDTTAQLRRDLAVQTWLLERTSPTEVIFLWAPDDNLHSMAGMQLWGPNRLFTDENGVIRHMYGRTPAPGPGDTIVTFARGSGQAASMEDRLTRVAALAEPVCSVFSLEDRANDTAHVCVFKPLA